MPCRTYETPMRPPGSFLERGFSTFLPCGIPGLSLFEHTAPEIWASDDKTVNPWYWRFSFAYVDDLFYGKFADGKLGFVRRDLFPLFAAVRRQGMTVEALLDTDLVSRDAALLFRALPATAEWALPDFMDRMPPLETKLETLTNELQMRSLFFTSGFRYRTKKSTGEEYGWPFSLFARLDDEFDEPLEGLDPSEAIEELFAAVALPEHTDADREKLRRMLQGAPKKRRAAGNKSGEADGKAVSKTDKRFKKSDAPRLKIYQID